MNSKLQKIKENSQKLQEEVRSKLVGYILTAFGVVAGLAWNDAITTIINTFVPGDKNTIVAKLIYAVIITVAVVILGIYISKLLKRDEGK